MLKSSRARDSEDPGRVLHDNQQDVFVSCIVVETRCILRFEGGHPRASKRKGGVRTLAVKRVQLIVKRRKRGDVCKRKGGAETQGTLLWAPSWWCRTPEARGWKTRIREYRSAGKRRAATGNHFAWTKVIVGDAFAALSDANLELLQAKMASISRGRPSTSKLLSRNQRQAVDSVEDG